MIINTYELSYMTHADSFTFEKWAEKNQPQQTLISHFLSLSVFLGLLLSQFFF